MNKLIKGSILSALVLFTSFTFAQREDGILFKSGTYHPEPINAKTDFIVSENEMVEGSYFRIIQFNTIPSNAVKSELANSGITLLDYLPRNAFYARISENTDLNTLSSFGVYSIDEVDSKFKLSRNLLRENYPHWSLFGSDRIELTCEYFEGVSKEAAFNQILKLGGEVLYSNYANVIDVRVPLNKLEEVYNLSAFYYFDAIAAPEEPENLDGRTNHRSNILATDYSTGLKYDGTGVNVMMQDDGYIGDHIDYQGRIDQTNCSPCSSNDSDNHGDHVAGTIMGAGNLNPRYRGMAFGAKLFVFNSSNANYDDVPTLYSNDTVVITSKSYSSSCNNYDSRARQLDDQIYTMPNLMHVFSAGNNGAGNCTSNPYGAGSGWGNITGGHKQAKNVLAVGNLTTLDLINNSSSRGPAEDGRIKPDICGVGTSVMSTVSDYLYDNFTGTSMSCPGVAGTITQLYHAYKDANGGNNPNSALIKAAVLNTAEDLGNPGPDFKYGWGRINARRAHELISSNNYQTSTVATGNTNSHTINVPAGVTKMKVMVYWADYRGSTSAAVTLVNDLNMTVTDPGLVTYQPLILDPTPNATALNSNAVPGTDNLNNAEQIVIDNPLPGTYTVDINGFAVPQGPQEYFMVYMFENDEITLTYPIGGEGWHPGSAERIRWDASAGTQPFTLEYSTDNGATWSSLGTATATERSKSIVVPSVLTGQARVRVSRGVNSDQSDAMFSIIPTPNGLSVDWSCPDSLNLTWNAVTGATGYEISMLGNKYMDSIGTTTLTNFTVTGVQATNEYWFSVRALGPNNARSERHIAIRKQPGEFGCTWSTPYALISVSCDSTSSADCVQFFNQSVNTDASSSYLWYFPTGTPATSTQENPTVCFTTPGYHDAALVVTNSAGSDSVYFTNTIFVQQAMSIPFNEGFEYITSFPNQSFWQVFNADNNTTFLVTGTAALSGSQSALIMNTIQSDGDIDALMSGPIDLSSLGANDTVTLSFRYSYRKKVTSDDDWLRIKVKDGCGGTWTVRKTIHGNFLSTDTQTSFWTPTDTSHWTTVHVTNITSNFFTGDFRMMFELENGGGNNFYLDDINIYSGAPSNNVVWGIGELEELSFELYPNPADEAVNISFSVPANEAMRVNLMDLTGKVIQSHSISAVAGHNVIELDSSTLPSGSYLISIVSERGRTVKRFIKK